MITKARSSAGTAAGTSERSTNSQRRHVALALTALLVVSALFVYGVPGARASTTVQPTGTSTATLPGAHVAASTSGPAVASALGAASGALRLAPHPAGAAPANGRGTFFDTTNLSHPGLQNLSCGKPYYFYPTNTCPNTTFDPSINVTASGLVGVAYTVWTNTTNCPSVFNISNDTQLDVAFQSSTNGGVTWNPLVYLGNQNCSQAQNLSDSWEPSLTSLSNGTLVLAYVQFSASTCSYYYCSRPYTPYIYPYQVPYTDLVVQESYNGGANWTAPTIVNSTFDPSAVSALCSSSTGFPAYRPSIAASGNSVFLAWENLTDANGCSRQYSAGVHMVTSTNGGVNWSAPVTFPTIGDGGHPLYNYYPTSYSVNPFVLAASNGQVYVTYATGLGYTQNYCTPSGCYPYGISTMDVVVANATGGVGNWTVRTAVNNTAFSYQSGSGNYGGFVGISPQIAYNGVNGQLYLVFPSVAVGTFCYNPSSCYIGDEGTTAFANSSNGGANWSQPEEVGVLINPYHGPENYEFYPTIAVDHNGTAHVMFTYYNESICVTTTYLYCGGFEQMYFNTSDNGTSWNGPFVISPYFVPPFDYPYMGEYESATTAPSGQVLLAWTNSFCPPAASSPYCGYNDPFEPESNTTVVVSWLYSGPGVTLSFTETNLTAAASWSAEVLGNYRAAPAGTSLSVSGVPPTEPVSWSVPWVNYTYGLAWQSTPAPTNPTPPTAFSSNATLSYSFAELVEVNVFVVPPIYTYYITAGTGYATYSMTPLPGSYWIPVNSSMTFTVAPQAITCTAFCYFYNLTWQSWTGTGPGSVSTNATSFSVTVGNQPINETANFLFTGYCYGNSGTLFCYNAANYPLTFHETGLPSGTSWGVTTVVNSSANGTLSNFSTDSWLNVSTGQTAVQYTVWTVPSSTAGQYWVPTSDPASPVKEPVQTLVNVTYTLQNASLTQFRANFTALGLPNGTTWSADVGNASFAVTAGNLSVTVPGGSSLALNGSAVYTEGGVGYYAAKVSVFPYVVNSTWQNTTTLPDAYTFDGSAHVYVEYEPMFYLTVTASSGGSVGPASRWVQDGAAVALNATPLTGYHFLDWASTGAGGTTVAQSHNATTTIHPTAPVSEFATFRLIPPPTWNVTVLSAGLPNGTAFTFTLGTTTYTSAGANATVGELLGGSYAFATTTAYATSNTTGVRWVPTSWYSTFGLSGGMLTIGSNGTIWVNFTTQYALTVASTPHGTVTPSTVVGSTWQDAGTVLTLTATPSYHYKFLSWNASGAGSMAGATPTISVTVGGPVWESASFVYRVFPAPALYWLTVTETGLPAGTPWNVSVAAANASGAGASASLNLTGLNGTYALTIPSVYVGSGTRYIANGSAPVPVTVTANGSTTVTFSEQFALTVLASTGGTVSGAGTAWLNSGAMASLTATPAAGYTFVNWTGTGTGGATSYSGPTTNPTVTMTGPTNETATFAPIVVHKSSGSATAGQPIAFGLLAVLLVVGLVVGLILGRRRGGSPSEPEGEASPEAMPADDTYGSAAPEEPMAPEPVEDGSQ